MSIPENLSQELIINEKIFEQSDQIAERIKEKDPAAGESLKESISKAKVNAFNYANETLNVLLGDKPRPVTENKSSHDIIESFIVIGFNLKHFGVPINWPKEIAKRDALIETAALKYVYQIVNEYKKNPSSKLLPTEISPDQIEETVKKFEKLDPVIRDNFFKIVKQ